MEAVRSADADVVVVGGGIAGASAAIEVVSRGCSVMGVDGAEMFGGTARVAGGGMCIPDSSMQRALGIEDSAQLAFDDLRAAGGDFDHDWALRYFHRASHDVFDWLGRLGVKFSDLLHLDGESVPRFHRPEGGGQGLMRALVAAGHRYGLSDAWSLRVRVIDLIVEHGRVSGVRCRRADGSEVDIRATSVVMATGGFAASVARIRAYATRLSRAPRVLAGGGLDATGDGLALLEKHGARLGHLDHLYCYATGVPDYRDPSESRGVVFRSRTGWVWLNVAGRRFHDESQMISGNVATPRLLAQPGATCWSVFDSQMANDVVVDDHYVGPGTESGHEAAQRHLAHSNYVWRSNTLEGLFQSCGLDPNAGVATIDEWNALLSSAQAHDPLTGRDLSKIGPLTTAPFFAVQFFPIARKAMGGVQTDMRCRVLQEEGGVLQGLFAAGELAGMAGGHIGGDKPLEGMMVGPSCFSGRIAGRSAADLARARSF